MIISNEGMIILKGSYLNAEKFQIFMFENDVLEEGDLEAGQLGQRLDELQAVLPLKQGNIFDMYELEEFKKDIPIFTKTFLH